MTQDVQKTEKRKKFGGRTKGTPNKATVEQKQRAERLLQVIETDYLDADIKKLTPLQRSNLYLGLMEYTLPKLRRVDGNLNANISFLDEETVFD
jgi:hypothetical protein